MCTAAENNIVRSVLHGRDPAITRELGARPGKRSGLSVIMYFTT